jgi:hypothetical protein
MIPGRVLVQAGFEELAAKIGKTPLPAVALWGPRRYISGSKFP